ncbi:MAG TPA: hypothetical protein HPP87_07230 [Planctomycetes bacterium]|nr:hypothetical protein [Planctomycetota bacterium]
MKSTENHQVSDRYTHQDADGLLWRLEEGRTISQLADEACDEVFSQQRKGKNGPPKIDLSFLKTHTTTSRKGEQYIVPEFGVYSFKGAHALEPFIIRMATKKAQRPLYIIQRKYRIDADMCNKKILLVEVSGDNNYYPKDGLFCVPDYQQATEIDLDGMDVSLIEEQAVYREVCVDTHPLIEKHLLRAMDRDNQYISLKGFFRAAGCHVNTIQIRSMYTGILPVEVQQLVHRAKRKYRDVVLIAEAVWSEAEVEILPVDPLIVGLTDDRADLLCKFEETIEENYMSSEFAKG